VISKPFGTEMIVLLTIPVPLFDELCPEYERGADYLRAPALSAPGRTYVMHCAPGACYSENRAIVSKIVSKYRRKFSTLEYIGPNGRQSKNGGLFTPRRSSGKNQKAACQPP
jgi:hypothetical protein